MFFINPERKKEEEKRIMEEFTNLVNTIHHAQDYAQFEELITMQYKRVELLNAATVVTDITKLQDIIVYDPLESICEAVGVYRWNLLLIQMENHTREYLLEIKGVGPATVVRIEEALKCLGLSLKEEDGEKVQ